MRSVNVAELKNRLSKYLTFAKGGEEVVIRDRNLPVAKLVPFLAEGADDQELVLVAAGQILLPHGGPDVKAPLKITTGKGARDNTSPPGLPHPAREPGQKQH